VTGSGGASPASLPSSPRAPRWARPVHARPSRLRRFGRRSRADADLGGGAGLASASPLARLFQAGVRARGWWPCGRAVSTSSLPSSSALLAGGGVGMGGISVVVPLGTTTSGGDKGGGLPRGFQREVRRRRARSSGERASPSSFLGHLLDSFFPDRHLLPRAPLPPRRARPTTEAMHKSDAYLPALRDGNVCISWIL
jgi:hypothetical protein